jgi:HK97 family phage major capsid protein/HK97 family phage prohead protease
MPIDLQQIKSASYCRNQTLKLRAEDVSGDELTFSFSSEEPVLRWCGTEVLSHEKGCANLDRLNDRGAFLFNHDRNKLLGSTLKAWLADDKRAYVTVRWSNRDDIQGYRQDVADGHLTHVSFAYDVLELVETKGSDTYLVTKWECFEVSLVTIPADPSVGIGRDRERPLILGATPLISRHLGENTMPTAARRAAEEERDRIRAIQILAERHRCEDLGEKAIEEDTPIEQFRLQVLERMSPPQQPIARPANPLGVGEQDLRSYSITRAINAQVTGDWSGAGFEREWHQELQKQGFRSEGLLVPMAALGRADRASYTVSGNVSGAGNLVETTLSQEGFIEALRKRSILMTMGMTELPGLIGNLDIPRQNGVSALGWIGENTDLPESKPTFDKISLVPKTVGCWCALSRLSLTQSTPALDELIKADFAQSLATELDRTGIHGSGVGFEPRGVLNTPGIGSVSLGINGGAPTWDAIVGLESLISQADADTGNLGYACSAAVRGKLKRTLKSASANSEFIWKDSEIENGLGRLNGYRALSSNSIRSNLTKGTGTNLSAIVFGNWAGLVMASWGALSLEVNPYGQGFRKGEIEVRVLMFADFGVRNPESFSAITDVLTT